MNSILENIYKTGQVEDAEGNLISAFPVATPYEVGSALNQLITQENLSNTLEVGMAYGLSSLFFCQAHRDKGTGSHTAIDPWQNGEWKSIGLLNVKRSGMEELFNFFEAPSYQVLPQLLTKGEYLDFAFIDGMHLFDYTLIDFFYIDKLLRIGGYICFDDMWMPGMRKVVDFVLRNRSYELIKFSTQTSLFQRTGRLARRFLQNPFERDAAGIKYISENICLIKKVSEDKRDWDFHRSF